MKKVKKPCQLKESFRNVVIMVATVLLLGTVSVSASVTDNLGDSIEKILGPVNAAISKNFVTSSTNGKLNQMKKDMDATKSSMTELLEPYLSSLTVWVNSTDSAYDGRIVTVTNNKGEKIKAAFGFKNGHYEATFPKLVRNSYNISYPFVLSGGYVSNMAISYNLVSGNNSRQLFGNIQQMSVEEIQACCKAGAISEIAKVGDTISDGKYTYTIIGINQDHPCDADGNLLNSSKYGDVLTLMALGAPAGAGDGKTPVKPNAAKTPYGNEKASMRTLQWNDSTMRTSTMFSYLDRLPSSTQKCIGYVQKATGYWTCEVEDNYKVVYTGDKCFLLSEKEITGTSSHTKEREVTFQYQYFQDIATTSDSRNFNGEDWYLRSRFLNPYPASNVGFYQIVEDGTVQQLGRVYTAKSGVFPAFCIY